MIKITFIKQNPNRGTNKKTNNEKVLENLDIKKR